MFLVITTIEKLENTLVNFPFGDNQFLDGEILNSDGTVELIVNLADQIDTNATQEQFLNTNDNVIHYKIAE